jgi:hypothetical protein
LYKKVIKYLVAHPTYNSIVHLSIGVGVGILATVPVFLPHPVRWGAAFLLIGLLGHAYPLLVKK